MKNAFTFILLSCLFTFGCDNNKETGAIILETNTQYKEVSSFQNILDRNNLKGTIIIYDEKNSTYYSNDFERAKKGFIPASTFKIPNTIIGLETGIINEETIFKWDGKKRLLKTWEKDLVLREAYHKSCVPCYQEVAREIGVDSMNYYLNLINFGDMLVDSNSIDNFWLKGLSKISPVEMIDFLTNVNHESLPFSSNTFKSIKKIMLMKEEKDYKISGKTGWAKNEGKDIGWFVGIEERKGKTLYITSNIEPLENFNMDDFINIRYQISKEALLQMDSIMNM